MKYGHVRNILPQVKKLNYAHGMIICDFFFKENQIQHGIIHTNTVDNLHLSESDNVSLGYWFQAFRRAVITSSSEAKKSK
jgi:hypothetical protein